ncbi:ABC transporter permease [Austwickia sp. TVS 96-490-7B]|uniref:ABC transporter permease n=1 Tax=Austwickia sp. TVS 96-490-7B TaxID=2830843 RepID=UPI002107DC2E|nr:ABC transporter permease [Austwickia sp. TVS 96-490-7B]
MPTVMPASALIRLHDQPDVIRLVVIVLALAILSAVLRRSTGLGDGRAEITAILRATLQLGAVGLIVAAVLDSWPLTGLFVVVMIAVATFTSARRIGSTSRTWPLLPVAIGSLPVVAVLLAAGLLPWQPISLVPTAGILVGNAMTATSLAGRRGLDALSERRGEVEAALALGLLDRDAALLVVRPAARLALVPGLDQTRTVGLVTLPGAFVGTLLGGATPLQAAALQLVVLAGILATQSIAVALTVELVARRALHRSE